MQPADVHSSHPAPDQTAGPFGRVPALLASLLILLGVAEHARAATTVFSSRAAFEFQLGTFIVDDYSDPAYFMGDIADQPTVDIHSDAQMSGVLGETDYMTTGFSDLNLIGGQPVDPSYCAGCNGSFLLSFTTTSVGDSTGVFGVGFEIRSNVSDLPFTAFVTFEDGSTADFTLPVVMFTLDPSLALFFGITSDLAIASIHLGLAFGSSTTDEAGQFVIDNLTIGDNAVGLDLDHFQCWQVKDLKNPKFEKRDVTLNDQFTGGVVEVKKLFLICAPADKDGSGISDPDTHQCCYKIKGAKLNPPARVEVTDQFGTHQAEVSKAKFLCQPCTKTVLP